MEHFNYLLFQLMKHGTNTLHVVFIFLFSILCVPHLLKCFSYFGSYLAYRPCGLYYV